MTGEIQLTTPACDCGRPWPDHIVVKCHGGILCGGYVDHNCTTPGCKEPQQGVHGADCRGYLIACPNKDTDLVKDGPILTKERLSKVLEELLPRHFIYLTVGRLFPPKDGSRPVWAKSDTWDKLADTIYEDYLSDD